MRSPRDRSPETSHAPFAPPPQKSFATCVITPVHVQVCGWTGESEQRNQPANPMETSTKTNLSSNSGANAGNPVIVQFFHSGRERTFRHSRGATTVEVPWARDKSTQNKCDGDCGGCSGHARRLVVHNGQYVDGKNSLRTENLSFWTEWEAETTAARMPQSSTPGNAKWYHIVKSPLVNIPRDGINTDPCVFGSTFKYCCCQQHTEGEKRPRILRRLPKDSMILFGSRFDGGFVLDTVFVVDKWQDYTEGSSVTISRLGISDQYRALSIDRLHDKKDNTFYRGALFNPNKGSIWSFTPAKQFMEGNANCGERFFLDVQSLNSLLVGCKGSLSTNPKKRRGIVTVHADPATVRKVWTAILGQVRNYKCKVSGNFVPAVRFDWPK